MLKLKLQIRMVRIEVDTGASAGVSNMEVKEIGGKSNKLMPVNGHLRTYSGEVLKSVEEIDGQLVYDNLSSVVSFIVADTKGPNLLGRDILRSLKLN